MIDARTLPNGTELKTDICIIGMGPAGITLAVELAQHSFDICLLESGGKGPDATVQALGETEDEGSNLAPAPDSRWRQIGGTANIWNTRIGHHQQAARYLPLDEIDFERREWLPFSGWPFDRSALEPYYRRAEQICGVDPFGYRVEDVPDGGRELPLDPTVIATTVEQFGTKDVFTGRHLETLRRTSNVRAFYNATVTQIETGENGRSVSRLLVCSSPAQSFTLSARVFILAAGGIENARILLLSPGRDGNGLGNQHDLVGRFYMDHYRINGGNLIPSDRRIFDHTRLYDLRAAGRRHVMGKMTVRQEYMRRHQLLNSSSLLWPRPSCRDDAAVDSMKAFVIATLRRRLDRGTAQHLRRVIAGRRYLAGTGLKLMLAQRTWTPTIASGGWSYLRNNARRFATFEIVHQVEQAPNPENRVTLGSKRDYLGRPLARVRSRWSEVDLESIRRVHDLFDRQFRASGLGSVRRDSSRPFPDLHQRGGIHHHMGTTRMHTDPRHGVVDPDCRVHDIGNLYIAGSSVFPTGGYANPTLTLLALTIRLADHLRMAGARPPALITAASDG